MGDRLDQRLPQRHDGNRDRVHHDLLVQLQHALGQHLVRVADLEHEHAAGRLTRDLVQGAPPPAEQPSQRRVQLRRVDHWITTGARYPWSRLGGCHARGWCCCTGIRLTDPTVAAEHDAVTAVSCALLGCRSALCEQLTPYTLENLFSGDPFWDVLNALLENLDQLSGKGGVSLSWGRKRDSRRSCRNHEIAALDSGTVGQVVGVKLVCAHRADHRPAAVAAVQDDHRVGEPASLLHLPPYVIEADRGVRPRRICTRKGQEQVVPTVQNPVTGVVHQQRVAGRGRSHTNFVQHRGG